MKIGLAQISPAWEDKTANRERCSEVAQEAAGAKIDLLVFPETTLTGFSMKTAALAEGPDGDSARFFTRLARDHGIGIVYGFISGDGRSRAANRLVWLDAAGERVMMVDKVHPFSYAKEDRYYVPGGGPGDGRFLGGGVSAFICFDLRFPELFQAVSPRAPLIVVIANWPAVRDAHWQILLRARAVETQSFIVGVNRAGTGNGLAYIGHSMIVSPRGETLLLADDSDRLFTAEIDISDALSWREEFPLCHDRRPELYRTFY